MSSDLNKKSIRVKNVAKKALEHKAALAELLPGTLAKKEKSKSPTTKKKTHEFLKKRDNP